MKVVILYNLEERLVCGEYGEARADESLKEELAIIEESLRQLGYQHRSVPIQHGTNILSVANLVFDLRPDCVFNLVEAVRGNYQLEMAIPALLDLMNVPYTGSNALTLGVCQDKPKSKAIMDYNGILVPRLYHYGYWHPFPVIVKPSMEDGSLGINSRSVVFDMLHLQSACAKIETDYRQPALIEEYIDGREFGVGVIDFNGGPTPFPVSEIVFDGYPKDIPKIVSYNSKWGNGTVEYEESKPHCPADINELTSKNMQALAMKVFKLFNCKGYARVDIRLRDHKFYVIDVNPNADCAPGSGIETVLKAAGVSYEEFVKNIIEGALRGR